MKLVLGSAQFGMNYGVTNQKIIPFSDVKKIIELSRDMGLKKIDSALNYKNSSLVLGKCGVKDFHVYTKTLSIDWKIALDNNIKLLEKSLSESIKLLKINFFSGLYIHNPNDIFNNNFEEYYNRLQSFKKKGIVKKIGFSLYKYDEFEYILKKNFYFDIVQIPVNIFDNTFVNKKFEKICNERNIEVFARSIFLQGILLNNPKEINPYFLEWKEALNQYWDFLKINNIKPIDQCIAEVKNIKFISNIIVGCNSFSQFKEILSSYKTNSYKNFTYNKELPDEFLKPNKWKII